MERYIGIDVHSTSCSIVVVDGKGRQVGRSVVETDGRALVAAVRAVGGQRRLCIEEGAQSAWLYEVLSHHVDEMVVTLVEGRRGKNKSDSRDALDLANRLRKGRVTAIFKGLGQYNALREHARVYRCIRDDRVRAMNRLKALYRARGVTVKGARVYGEERSEFLSQLPTSHRAVAELLYAQYDTLTELRADAEAKLVEESQRHPITRILRTAPGLGKIRVAELIPIVVTPWRFRTARQFWSYCGLGIVMQSSNDYQQSQDGSWSRVDRMMPRGLNRHSNRVLKNVFKSAAYTVVTRRTDPLWSRYEALTKAGTKPNLARLTTARQIAAITLAMWKNQEPFDPQRLQRQ